MKTIFRTMFLAGAVVMMASCDNAGKKADALVEVDTVPSVSVVKVGVQEVPQEVTYTSTVQPFVKNNIVPQAGNRIKKINVEVGDFVKKGQILAEMDLTQLQQAELQLLNNEIELERLRKLYDAGGLSKSDLDAVEMAYKVSKNSYENLLENSILRSPIDGVVSARNYDVGDMYAMSAPLFTVEQIKPVKLRVAVSEADYSKVKKGDSVEITADAVPETTFYGKVERVFPTVDPATRTVTVEVLVANNYNTLRPGMFTRVKLNYGTNKSVVIPDVAVVKQQGSGERFVYVLNEDGTVTYQEVLLGRRMGTEYEVLEGLKDGDTVVTGGQIRLKNGVKVEVK